MACSEASRERRWLLHLCKETKQHNANNDNVNAKDDEKKNNQRLPIPCDNEGTLTHIINGTIKARTKLKDLRYYNRRNLHERGIVKY